MDNNTENKMYSYCLICKDKKEMINGKVLTNKKSNKYLQGTCECGCKINKFLKKQVHSKIDIDLIDK